MTRTSLAQLVRVLIAKHGNLLSAFMIAKGTKEKRQITDNKIAENLITFLEFSKIVVDKHGGRCYNDKRKGDM